METQRQQWDDYYQVSRPRRIDPWLERFATWLSAEEPVLDLGCGDGSNLEFLLSRSLRVHAMDYSPVAIQRLQANYPEVQALVGDLRHVLPWRDGTFGAVVADLSLHYFGTEETLRILNEVSRVLTAGGVLLARVNSTRDLLHGAGQGQEIEPGYFVHQGKRKRFFDARSIEFFFSARFSVGALQETASAKYGKEKILWELAACPREERGADGACAGTDGAAC